MTGETSAGVPSVLVNATSVVVGGGVQAAVSFIRHVLDRPSGLQWHFALSRAVASQLPAFGISERELRAELFQSPPARDRSARKLLRKLETRIGPDAVFTIFGPAYVRFQAPHLCGVGDGWVTHATPVAYGALGGAHRAIGAFLKSIYKGLWFRVASRWVVEEQSARQGLCRRFGIPADRIHVVANGCADHYQITAPVPPLLTRNGRFRLLTFASYYAHKNLEIIPVTAAHLKRLGMEQCIEFVTTIRPDEPGMARLAAMARDLGVTGMLNNVGPVDISDGPRLYKSCDAVFMPSLLETFSATYPEAMAMGLPIVATDLEFARNICGKAAIYYSAKDPAAAAEAIRNVYHSPQLRARLVAEGTRRLSDFPTAGEKNAAIVELIRQTARDGRAGREELH